MARVKTVRWILISLCILIVMIFTVLTAINGSYLGWDYNDAEFAVAGTILHGFEFVFVRLAPIAILGSVVGIIITYKKR